MRRHHFQWTALPQPLLHRLARDLALPGSLPGGAARALEEAYGRRPEAGFVRDTWPTLRDAWLAKDAAVRRCVVEELRSRGLGDTTLPARTRPQQMAYLATCEPGPQVRAVVLAAFHDLGVPAEPPPVPDEFEAGLHTAWVAFAALLEEALRALGEGFVAVVLPAAATGEQPDIVFCGTAGGIRATLGCHGDDLPLEALVGEAQRQVLRDLGWSIDAGGMLAALGAHQRPAALAAAAVVTVREVFGVVHPSFLTPVNFGAAKTEPDLDALVDAALAPALGGTVERDGDGDVVIDFGAATGYVRVATDGYVSVFTPLLYDVPGDALVLERLNQLNRSWRVVRFTWAGGVVTATADIWCRPFVPALVRQAVEGMAGVVGQLHDLQLRLGGRVSGCVDDD